MFDPSTFENFIFSQARTLSINDDLRQMILPKIYRLPRLRLSHLGTFSHVKRVYVKYTVAVVAAARAHPTSHAPLAQMDREDGICTGRLVHCDELSDLHGPQKDVQEGCFGSEYRRLRPKPISGEIFCTISNRIFFQNRIVANWHYWVGTILQPIILPFAEYLAFSRILGFGRYQKFGFRSFSRVSSCG